jgi:hypothetical protein
MSARRCTNRRADERIDIRGSLIDNLGGGDETVYDYGSRQTAGRLRDVNVQELLKEETITSYNGPDADLFHSNWKYGGTKETANRKDTKGGEDGGMVYAKSTSETMVTTGISDIYILLDSAQKTESSDIRKGTYTFNFAINGITNDQSIGVGDTLSRMFEIEVAPFYIPLLNDVPYVTNDPQVDASLPRLVANTAQPITPTLPQLGPMTQLPFGARITMEFRDLKVRSFSDSNNVQHHFEFEVYSVGNMKQLLCVPLNGFEKFIFTEPIKDLHGLTIIFRNPFVPVAFQEDVLYNAKIQADIGGNNFLEINYKTHGLIQDDRIYFEGVSTTDAVINAWLLRQDGHIVGANGLTADTFRLNPDVDVAGFALGIGVEIPSTARINILIARNRIRIPLRMRRVVDKTTNRIVHT